MMPPSAFTAARLAARHHIQARLLRWDGAAHVRVTRVFKGDLKRGDRLSLTVNVAHDGPALRVAAPNTGAAPGLGLPPKSRTGLVLSILFPICSEHHGPDLRSENRQEPFNNGKISGG